MTLKTVKLSTLRLSPLNVRTVEPTGIEAMAADIESHGVLQNLVAYRQGRNHMVCAGGRRFRGLKLLQKRKTIDGNYGVPVDIRSKKEAVELSLAENSQREDMHPADCVAAYGELIRSGLSAEDISARFGVSPTHVKRVLKLSALHPAILEAFAKDEIGMGAAQAYTLTDDPERQLEVFEVAGDNRHQVRSILTDEKIDTKSKLFRFVPLEEYKAAGGTITADLFAEEGDGYADNPDILFRLVEEKLAAIEEDYCAAGWKEVVRCDQRPDNFYSLNLMQPEGRKEPTKAQAKKLEANAAAQQKIIDEDEADRFYNSDLRALEREQQDIEASLSFYTDEQKAHGKAIIFLGYDGELEIHAVDLNRKKSADVTKLPKPDYSAKLTGELTKIKTLAVREAVANDPALALDLLLQALLEQLIHDRSSYALPLSLKPDARPVEVDEDLLAQSEIAAVEDIAAKDVEALSAENDLPSIRAMDGDAKQRLLAALIASQIDASGCYGEDGIRRMDEIVTAADIDMHAKWQPSVGFFQRISKPVLLKILKEQCGEAAAENCARLKKSDLAVEMAERLAGKDWLPTALMVGKRVDDDARLEEAA